MSKKATLTALSAILMATSAYAGAERFNTDAFKTALTDRVKTLNALTTGKKAPARINSEADVITSPEGTEQKCQATATGFYVYGTLDLVEYSNETVATSIIYGDNDEVYFYDIVPYSNLHSYVKGVRKGDVITVDLPQTAYYDDEFHMGLNVEVFNYRTYIEDGQEMQTYEPDTTVTSIDLKVGADGVITLTGLADEAILGLSLNEGGTSEWAGYGVSSLSIEPLDEVPVTVPEGLAIEPYSLTRQSDGYIVRVARTDTEIYIGGLSASMPDGWFKGDIHTADGATKVSVKANQFMGVYGSNYMMYTKFARRTGEVDQWGDPIIELMPDDYVYEMNFDLEHLRLTPADPEVAIVVNGGKDEFFDLVTLFDYAITYQDSYAGTPAAPFDLSYMYGNFVFNIPSLSTERTLLDTDELYYVVLVDGEEYEFNEDEYALESDMVEIPYDFRGVYITNWGGSERTVRFFIEEISTIGVQSVYYCNGVETRSAIVTLDTATGEITTGIADAIADKQAADVAYFDLSGRRVANPANGIYVRHTTFTDGTTQTAKAFVR